MDGRHSATPPADAWAHARDPRFNARPTLSRLHGEERRTALLIRAEARRRHYMETYAPKPVVLTRQRDRFAKPYEYLLAGVVVFVTAFAIVGLL